MVIMTSGWIGIFISMILFILYLYKVLEIPLFLILIILGASLLASIIGGLSMQREITRRL